jgi:hypothetical protein
MKKIQILSLALFVIFLYSCTSPKKMIEKGDYKGAVPVLVKKIQEKQKNQKFVPLLNTAFHNANRENQNRITELRQSGQPDIWFDLFQNYIDLDKRQKLVAALPENILAAINFKNEDYKKYLEDSRKKAATFLYAHATKLLGDSSKVDARQAYSELKKITILYKNYKNVDELLPIALFKGTNNVVYEVDNNSTSVLPVVFLDALRNIDLSSLNEEFVNFDNRPLRGIKYDFQIKLDLRSVQLTPEKQNTQQILQTREAQTGWIEQRDSTGKVIKVPEYGQIKCEVTIVELYKAAKISGFLDFINIESKQVILSSPVSAKSIFQYKYATANGNLDACSDDVMLLINQPRVGAPAEQKMILDAADKLNKTILDVILDDEGFLK